MNDILFGNNNRPIIIKLSNRSFQQNKIRNAIAALAIFFDYSSDLHYFF